MNNKPKDKANKQEIFDKTKNLRISQPELKRKKEFTEKYMPSDSFLEKLNKYLREYKIIHKICQKLSIDPIYILIICLIPIIILLFMYFTFTTTMIALIYPLYMSFKTLQKKTFSVENEEAETTRWLSYWLIYAFINNSECIFWKFLEKIKIYNFITSRIFDKYGEKFEKNTVEFFRKIFGGKKDEKSNKTGELIDDDFAKIKKNE